MGRDQTQTDNYITVPTFFKCPISLDVMKSPVSLCTGVTYDRPSIQRWLDGRNNTCPATMQILQTKDYVPNLTLQRLLKAWSDSIGGRSEEVKNIPTKEEVKDSFKILSMEKDDEIRLEILSRIIRFLKESNVPREKEFFLSGNVPMLVDIIATTNKTEVVFLAITVLDVVKERYREERLVLANFLSAILNAIRDGSVETKIESVRVLEWFSMDVNAKLLIVEHEGILMELVKMISVEFSDVCLMEVCLSFLINVSKSKRVRSKVIMLKIIPRIEDILRSEENISVSVTEKALKLLETLSSKREGRLEICKGGRCVEGVVSKLLKVSTTATEHAVTILWCLCYVFREGKSAVEAVERCNGLTKLLVVIQSHCSVMVRQMAKDLIKVIKVGNNICASDLVAYETKTTHITPF